jgi:hypothetical protein
MQPGDNFRVAASCEQLYLAGVTVNVLDLRDASGAVLPTLRGKQTAMLTVWRRVHAEVDSMGVVANNHAAGTIERVSRMSCTTTTTPTRAMAGTRMATRGRT